MSSSTRISERSDLANLILAGVGKAGTTSLFWYLSQHPSICASKIKETRYFLPLSEAGPSASRELPGIAEYAKYFSHCARAPFRMEATPHYFHGGPTLVAAIRRTLPDIRIVLLLRDPVDRFWSIFRFAKSMLLIPADLSLSSFVAEATRVCETRDEQTVENRPYWTSIRGSMYSEFLPSWTEAIPPDRLKIIFFEDLRQHPDRVVSDVCSWLEIDTNVRNFSFSVENQSFDYRSRTLQRFALFLNSEQLLRNQRALKQSLRPIYRFLNQAKSQPALPDEVRSNLRKRFASSNDELRTQLRDLGETRLPDWLASPTIVGSVGGGR